MTNTNHTHRVRMVLRLADVRLSLVVKVGGSAIKPLAGSPEIVTMQSYTKGNDPEVRLADVEWTFHATNDNEAQRTVRVMRAAMGELLEGSMILEVGEIR